MAILLEHLLQNRNRWAIQVIQHTVSLLSNMPLRLMDWRKMGAEAGSNDRDFLHTIDEDLLAKFKKRSNSPWITTARNIHPLIDYLRRNWTWLACERQFFRKWLESAGESVSGPEPYYTDDMNVAAYRFDIKDIFNGVLVVGPVFSRALESDSWPGGLAGAVDKFVTNISDEARELGIENTFDRHEMLLRGRGTGWIYTECLMEDAELVGDTLHAIFAAGIDSPEIGFIRNRSYHDLAQAAYLLHRDPALISKTLGETGDSTTLSFKLDLHTHLVLRARPDKGGWRLSLVRDDDMGRKRVAVQVGMDSQGEPVRKAETKLVKVAGELSQSFAYRQHGFMGQKVKRLSRWLHNYFGVVSAEPEDIRKLNGDEYRDPEEKEAFTELARRISELFNADIVSIFMYHHAERKLKAKIIYFQKELEENERKDWQNSEYASMAEAASSPHHRMQSIAYRAAENRGEQFCRALLPGRGGSAEFEPSNQPILNPYPELFKRRSAIAVPMLVHGLLLGVLEIDGFCQYQFRGDSVQLAQEIADIVGPFLYQREVLRSLSTLSEAVLNDDQAVEERYARICEVMARVFLADASVLFMPPPGRKGEYALEAWYNRDDLEPLMEKEQYLLRGLENDSPVIQALASKKFFNPFRIADLEEQHPGWTEKVPSRKSTAERFNELTIIPIRDPRKAPDENLCALSLDYVRSAQETALRPLIERWEPTAQLVSHFVAICVGAMHTRRDVEQRMQGFLAHEIVHLAESVKLKSDLLRTYFKENLPEDIIHPATTAADDLDGCVSFFRKFTALYREDEFRTMLATGVDPYLYLMTKDGVNLAGEPETIKLSEFLAKETLPYGVKFPRQISTDFHQMSADLIRIHKQPFCIVLTNLFVNANKYSLPGTVMVVRGETDMECHRIMISNVSKCLRDKLEELQIFAPYSRGSNIDRSFDSGVGLGLHIVRTLCRHFRISLDLEIEHMDPGTCQFTFSLELPHKHFQVDETEGGGS